MEPDDEVTAGDGDGDDDGGCVANHGDWDYGGGVRVQWQNL